jgi:hypothetical protein
MTTNRPDDERRGSSRCHSKIQIITLGITNNNGEICQYRLRTNVKLPLLNHSNDHRTPQRQQRNNTPHDDDDPPLLLLVMLLHGWPDTSFG